MAKFFQTVENISKKIAGDTASPTYETRKTFFEGLAGIFGFILIQQLGKKGSAVYQQEFFSFCNIKSVGRDHNWSQKFKILCEEIEKNNPELLASLKIKYQHLDPKIR